jgi:hypothetical protein
MAHLTAIQIFAFSSPLSSAFFGFFHLRTLLGGGLDSPEGLLRPAQLPPESFWPNTQIFSILN